MKIKTNKFKALSLLPNMVEEQQNPQFNSPRVNLIDIEERQRIVKDRLILVGQNLIDFKEKNDQEILELKKQVEELKNITERTKNFLETISSEFEKFAKKEDLEILRKQAKMFQPLEFIKKSDLPLFKTPSKETEELKNAESSFKA